jgi:hypothetical protein
VRGGALIRTGLAVLSFAFAAAAQAGPNLEPYAACDGLADDIRIKRKAPRPAEEPPWREVTVKGATRRISVVDGIRVVYAAPGGNPFADLKAEASDPARYPEDKRELKAMFEAAARSEGPGAYKTLEGRGYTGQEVVKPAIEGSTLAITQLFFDADKVVVSIYFPNVPALGRSFASHAQFVALRAKFVRNYLDCIGRNLK